MTRPPAGSAPGRAASLPAAGGGSATGVGDDLRPANDAAAAGDRGPGRPTAEAAASPVPTGRRRPPGARSPTDDEAPRPPPTDPALDRRGARRHLRPGAGPAGAPASPTARCRPRRSSWATTAASGSSTCGRRPPWPHPTSSTGTWPPPWRPPPWWPARSGPRPRARTVPPDALVAALPFLQRAALDPVASRTLRGKKAILAALRDQGAAAAGIEVPKLIEPRRISWVNLVLVLGHADRRVGPDRRARQRDQVVEHHHRGEVGLGRRRVRAGPGRLSGPGGDHGRLGHRHPALRPDRRPRGGQHVRVAGRRVDGGAGHPGPVLPAAGLRRHPGRQLRRAHLDGQLDRQGRPLPDRHPHRPRRSSTSARRPTAPAEGRGPAPPTWSGSS